MCYNRFKTNFYPKKQLRLGCDNMRQIPLQWCHMVIQSNKIIKNLTIFSTAHPTKTSTHYFIVLLLKPTGIIFHYKKLEVCKMFSCNDIIMLCILEDFYSGQCLGWHDKKNKIHHVFCQNHSVLNKVPHFSPAWVRYGIYFVCIMPGLLLRFFAYCTMYCYIL